MRKISLGAAAALILGAAFAAAGELEDLKASAADPGVFAFQAPQPAISVSPAASRTRPETKREILLRAEEVRKQAYEIVVAARERVPDQDWRERFDRVVRVLADPRTRIRIQGFREFEMCKGGSVYAFVEPDGNVEDDDIYLCPKVLTMSPKFFVNTMIHEAMHLSSGGYDECQVEGTAISAMRLSGAGDPEDYKGFPLYHCNHPRLELAPGVDPTPPKGC